MVMGDGWFVMSDSRWAIHNSSWAIYDSGFIMGDSWCLWWIFREGGLFMVGDFGGFKKLIFGSLNNEKWSNCRTCSSFRRNLYKPEYSSRVRFYFKFIRQFSGTFEPGKEPQQCGTKCRLRETEVNKTGKHIGPQFRAKLRRLVKLARPFCPPDGSRMTEILRRESSKTIRSTFLRVSKSNDSLGFIFIVDPDRVRSIRRDVSQLSRTVCAEMLPL